jgi:hypothetical protein
MFSSVTEISPMTTLRQRMLEDLCIRNYAPSIVRCCGRSVAEFARHFNQPPDQLGPPAVESIVTCCLRKSPADRFPSMGQVKDAVLAAASVRRAGHRLGITAQSIHRRRYSSVVPALRRRLRWTRSGPTVIPNWAVFIFPSRTSVCAL